MELNKDTLEAIRKVAFDWPQGVIILNPFETEYVILAVVKVDPYDPANNIHHTTIVGKDITLLISQKLSIPDLRGPFPIPTYIDNIGEEQTWEVSHMEKWYWIKIQSTPYKNVQPRMSFV